MCACINRAIRCALRLFVLVTIIATSSCKNNSPEQLWKLSLKSRPYADVIVDGNRFYVFSQAGEAVAGEIATGKRIWSRKVTGPILGTPVCNNDSVFLVTENGAVLRLQKENGSIQWQTQLNDQFIASLAESDGVILIPSESGTLYALSAKDGSGLWQASGQRKFNARPIVSGNHIYIGGWGKQFLCLKKDGSESWKFTAAEIISEEAVVLKNVVFFPAHNHFVYSLETQTGKLRWRFPANRPSNVVLHNQELVFASGKDLLFLSPQSGKLLRRMKVGRIITRIYSTGPHLYIVSRDVLQVSPSKSMISVVIDGQNAFYKLTFAPGMILALDDLYSIYGYEASRNSSRR